MEIIKKLIPNIDTEHRKKQSHRNLNLKLENSTVWFISGVCSMSRATDFLIVVLVCVFVDSLIGTSQGSRRKVMFSTMSVHQSVNMSWGGPM